MTKNQVLTAEMQQEMTPESVIERLKAGNKRYISGELTSYDHLAQIPLATTGQYPMAAIVSCVDSRVVVESVFDCGIGDLFVARVAGNFVNTDIVGSLEFATKVSGSKVVVVLGHESCGAVKSAIDKVELGNITPMLKNIEPAVTSSARGETPEADLSSANKDFVSKVVNSNVVNTIERIRQTSSIMAEMEQANELAIVGAIYSLQTGQVEYLD